ncbi:MAG TPA: HRDC domain-containing protein, partial [Longimicrobiaceae bacterium]|nr:HRDC domain-containing protein [Longimicrobiaceae bacterium]
GILVLDTKTPIPRLPIDWRALDRRKNSDLRKLQKMQGYVYTDGCRRAFVLHYFGEEGVERECSACDTCLGETVEAEKAPAPSARRRGARGRAVPAAPPPGPVDPSLLGRLKQVRTRLAREEKVPAYCVFSDAILSEIAARKPNTAAELLDIKGVGPAKIDKYGASFLDVLRQIRAGG